ncbi:MAG TPA: DUF86 domain-containing protein [Candidatus Aerophobetes bacterium]|uniref:DUF86 domain-containing protein n=1 Tax=Aerophobetes bacterium TaxID=2030807 RepID=A0A7V0MYK5_UNCAE|nr:DUF86 domain-containing protein [Candidatus Aerophobetes bacterium]
MRDVVIHEYFGLDLNLIWEVVQRDLPDLKQELLVVLKKFEKR